MLHCPKSNSNFRDITWNVMEDLILQEIFRVLSRFPVTFHVTSRKIDFLWDSVVSTCSWQLFVLSSFFNVFISEVLFVYTVCCIYFSGLYIFYLFFDYIVFMCVFVLIWSFHFGVYLECLFCFYIKAIDCFDITVIVTCPGHVSL